MARTLLSSLILRFPLHTRLFSAAWEMRLRIASRAIPPEIFTWAGQRTAATTFPEQGARRSARQAAAQISSSRKLIQRPSGPVRSSTSLFLAAAGTKRGVCWQLTRVATSRSRVQPLRRIFLSLIRAYLLLAGMNVDSQRNQSGRGRAPIFNAVRRQWTTSPIQSGGLALDPSGNIFVSADTSSTNLPVTAGAFQPTLTGNLVDGFLAVFQPADTPSLTYCTYLGAEANEEMGVGGIAVDAARNAYLVAVIHPVSSAPPFPRKMRFSPPMLAALSTVF